MNNLEKVQDSLIGQEMTIEILEHENKDKIMLRIDTIVTSVEIGKILTNTRLILNDASINVYFDNYEPSPFKDILDLYLDEKIIGHLCLNGTAWEDIFEDAEKRNEYKEKRKEMLLTLIDEFDCDDCDYIKDGECMIEDCVFELASNAIKFEEDK